MPQPMGFGMLEMGAVRQNDAYHSSQELIANIQAQAAIEVARINGANAPQRTPGSAVRNAFGVGAGGGGGGRGGGAPGSGGQSVGMANPNPQLVQRDTRQGGEIFGPLQTNKPPQQRPNSQLADFMNSRIR